MFRCQNSIHLIFETRIIQETLFSNAFLRNMYMFILLSYILLCLLSQRCLWRTFAAYNILSFHFQHEFLPSLLSLIVINALTFSAIEYATSVKIRVSLFYLHQIFSRLLPFSCQYNHK